MKTSSFIEIRRYPLLAIGAALIAGIFIIGGVLIATFGQPERNITKFEEESDDSGSSGGGSSSDDDNGNDDDDSNGDDRPICGPNERYDPATNSCLPIEGPIEDEGEEGNGLFGGGQEQRGQQQQDQQRRVDPVDPEEPPGDSGDGS
jgi:hypothetical protein